MNLERMNNVLVSPLITEKSATLTEEHKQFVFKVASDATKREIKAAIEKLFNVVVKNVQVLNVKGKEKRFGKTLGKRKDWKKAFVCLAEGHDLNFSKLQ